MKIWGNDENTALGWRDLDRLEQGDNSKDTELTEQKQLTSWENPIGHKNLLACLTHVSQRQRELWLFQNSCIY